MDNYRYTQAEDYGILRKKEGKEEELFVFGYSCKIYEDYDKSLYVDQGKHLIPWLGDESLKIDRYDCRGALNDLAPYLPKSEGFDRLVGLSNEEKRIESLCDQERFRALIVNEDEELLYQEEEMKRLQKALNNENSYGEVAFSYDEDSKPVSETSNKDSFEDEEDQFEQFIPPYQLDVPVGMKIPKSRKHHEIIEKTAFFISEQGAQMEILLKMKQADNPQFNFLSFDDELHSYYRHMMTAIKNGRYKQTTQTADNKDSETSKSESTSENTYLHPSLIPSTTVNSLSVPQCFDVDAKEMRTIKKSNEDYVEREMKNIAPTIPTISYKPSNDCTYSALVNRIKETQSANRDQTLFGSAIKKPTILTSLGSANDARSDFPPTTDSIDDAKNSSALLFDGLSKSARRRRARKEKEKEKNKAAVSSYKIYYTEEQVDDDESSKKDENEDTREHDNDSNTQDSLLLKPIPAPAAVLQIPPPDIQLIIDKMASYVVKNGRDFEAVVKAKGDSRFSFLDKEHIYNPFYCQKVELYLQLENAAAKPPASAVVARKIQKLDTDHLSKRANSKTIKPSRSSKPIPICFSIKKPKEEELAVRSALPYEESEGEDGMLNEENASLPGADQPPESNEEKNSDNTIVEVDMREITSPKTEKSETVEATSSLSKTPEMTLEKWAQERLVAKLVTAAKEKLAAKDRHKLAARDRDKQLQAERRRRAAEFINLLQKERSNNQIKATEVAADTKNVSNGKKESSSDVITILSDSASESDSIVSIPSCCDERGTKVKIDKKRRSSERSESRSREKDRRGGVEHRNKKSKRHRSRSASRTRSRSHSHSRHSSRSIKYKKHDKEKSHSKKKKHHHHYQNSSSHSHKESRKSVHKSKRSRYLNDGESRRVSDSDSSSRSSGSEMTMTTKSIA